MIKKIIGSSLFKSSSIYTVTSVINAAIPFLLIPLLTRVFSPSDYGIVSMVAIMINIVTPFIGVSAQGAIHRKYFEDDEETDFPRYVGNSLLLLLGSSLFFLIIFVVFGSFISTISSVPANWLFVILAIAICQFVSLILLTIWQVKVEPLKYGALQIGQSIINVGLSLFFIYQLRMGWESRVWGQLIAVLLAAVFSLFFLLRRKYVRFEFNKNDLKDILQFSLPLIPHTLGGLLIAFTDRILITNMIGVAETGVYTVAFQIGSIINLITSAFSNAYIPWLYPRLNMDDLKVKVKIVKFTYVYFAVLLIGAIVSVFVIPFFVSFLVGAEFASAGIYSIWIVLGYVFNGMYLMVTGFIFYAKKTSMLSKITLSLSLLNIPICYLFIRHFGAIGAAISMSLVYGGIFICTWYLCNKVYKMPWFNFNQV